MSTESKIALWIVSVVIAFILGAHFGNVMNRAERNYLRYRNDKYEAKIAELENEIGLLKDKILNRK
jgi:hypothetical protein